MTESEVIALITLVGVLFAALVGVVGVVLANKQAALDSVVDSLRSELASTRSEVTANERRIKALERRDRALVNYVHRLRRHITEGLGPPPPEWPADLEVD